MDNKKLYIELSNGDKIIVVNPKTKKMKYELTDVGGHASIQNKRGNAEEFCSIKNIEIDTLKCLSCMEVINNHSMHLNMPEEMKQNLSDILTFLYNELEENAYQADDVVITEQLFQSVTIYGKEKNHQENDDDLLID